MAAAHRCWPASGGFVKKFLVLLFIAAAVFVVWDRHRLYVRDPLGNVARDGAKEKGAQVYINYSNDVLLANYNPPMYVTVVQHGEPAGTPAIIHCIAYVACLLDADVATLLEGTETPKAASMTAKTVEFRDTDNRDTVVTLR